MIFILMRWPAAWLCIPLSKWIWLHSINHTATLPGLHSTC